MIPARPNSCPFRGAIWGGALPVASQIVTAALVPVNGGPAYRQPQWLWPLDTGQGVTHNLTTLCLNGTRPRVDFMDVIMGDVPVKALESGQQKEPV